ncbi:MAG TPA: SRPBCC family protein [Caulobacteraceae bacterium]|nr:SRPBCC family protein [Caulobacteraceae bacterium]
MDEMLQQVGVVVREVRSLEHEGRPARVVVASRIYDTTVEDLWNALTDPERIPRWFLPISGDLHLGGRYQFQGNAGGTITACEPPRLLGATWEGPGGPTSWVKVELEPEAGGRARLTLEHMAHVDGDFWDRFGPGAVGVGWDGALRGLGLHIATGAAVDPANAMAWAMSEDGKAFNAACSEAWGGAAIAAGEDPAKATRAAARTTAFYTGQPVPD